MEDFELPQPVARFREYIGGPEDIGEVKTLSDSLSKGDGLVTLDQCREAIQKDRQRREWQPIETAPKDGRKLLLGYFNSHGKWRTLRGQWFSANEIAETWEDEADEGWYETSVECYDVPNCWWTEPTHWMPLPPAPANNLPLKGTP